MAAGLVMLFSGCAKQIDMNLDQGEREVVVMSNGSIGTPLQVGLSYSDYIYGVHHYDSYGHDRFQQIDGAKLTLRVNGSETYVADGRDRGKYLFAYSPQEGDNLQLKVEVPGRDEVSASAKVPYAVQISEVNLEANRGEYNDESRVSFVLSDRANENEYYGVRVRVVTTHRTELYYAEQDSLEVYDDPDISRYETFYCSDRTIIDNSEFSMDEFDDPEQGTYTSLLLFTDGNISGQSHKINLELDWLPDYHSQDTVWQEDGSYAAYFSTSSVYLEVYSFSRDMYIFQRTVAAYNDDDFFGLIGEPIQVHSNINGGLGIFGISNVKQILLTPNDNNTNR